MKPNPTAAGIIAAFIMFGFFLHVFGVLEPGVIEASGKAISNNHPYSLGYMSNLSGVPANGNPYLGENRASTEWLKGWIMGNLEGK